MSVIPLNLGRRGHISSMLWIYKQMFSSETSSVCPHFSFSFWPSYMIRNVRSIFERKILATSLPMAIFVEIEIPPNEQKHWRCNEKNKFCHSCVSLHFHRLQNATVFIRMFIHKLTRTYEASQSCDRVHLGHLKKKVEIHHLFRGKAFFLLIIKNWRRRRRKFEKKK